MEFVCERGMQFEDDPDQENVVYTCQDTTQEDISTTRGFFDSPLEDEDWPRCVEGIGLYYLTNTEQRCRPN